VLCTRSRDRKTTDGYPSRLLDWVHAGQTRSVGRATDSYPALVSYAGPPQQPLQFIPPYPPILKKVRKVGAPLGVLILLGTIAGLIIIALTAFNPVGTLVHTGQGRDVAMVIVDGRIVVEGGRATLVDEDKIRLEGAAAARALWTRVTGHPPAGPARWQTAS